MSARSKARKRAVEVLYEAEVRGEDPSDILAARVRRTEGPPLNPYIRALVDGVQAHRARIDDLISTYAEGWTLDRMPVVDRNILRVGAYELFWGEVPEGVAISEAVALAGELSTDESATFVNGLLGRFKQLKPQLTL
ncbi:transcription antitermination factor NusB [Bailinhaonella thermotolerans]|uniref:Transcription antitermination protein NusB n=1 Tax=Bailinhaonella thermotolerans TaxID=1070861 RepID=A0A3A4AQB8_9ACTN|nr:transcription antitermination factor NusB [Bailinhaonella thermotolerans]RJL31251.1 transcription antitermination factor NusB [Bailinhaonella thermotolerans]